MNPNEPRPEDLPPHLRQLREKLVAQNAANAAADASAKRITEPGGRWFMMSVGLLIGCGVLNYFVQHQLGLSTSMTFGIPLGSASFGIGLTVFILAAIMARFARLRLRRGRERRAEATGIVVDSTLEQSPASTGGGWVYRLVVQYQFEAEGRTITAAYRPSDAFHNMMSRHEKSKAHYPPGKVARIYYDPEQPQNAAPVRPSPALYLSLMALYILGAAISSGGAVLMARTVLAQVGGG